MIARHIDENSAEEVVQPLPCAALADFHLLDFRGLLWRRNVRGFVTSCFH
jgi:hypothetical protein